MIGIDTNVILRFVVQDDPEQARRAVALFRQLSAEHPGFINSVTIAEVAWVLRSAYDAPRTRIAEVIEFLLDSREIRIDHPEAVLHALRLYRRGSADFSDCLIERLNHVAGCQSTVTFDRTAAKSARMRLL